MEKLFLKLATEYGIFAGLFVITLYVFARYINNHHKEIIKMNNGLGKRLNEVEKYVKESLLEVLIDTRAVLSHSTTINEIAIRELGRKLPESDLEMTDTQAISKLKLEEINEDTQKLKKLLSDTAKVRPRKKEK